MVRPVLILLAALGLASCTVSTNRAALPAGLVAAETIAVEGANGPGRGRLTIGANTGPFSRSLTETTSLEVYERDGGRTRLSLSGPDLPAGGEIDCVMKRRAFTAQGVTVPTAPISYLCTMGGSGRMVLDTAVEIGGPYPFPVRTGQVRTGEVVLNIRSLHAYEGIEREAVSPVGYTFARGDQVVGALDSLMPPKLILSGGMSPEERATVMLAAGALALAWEPDAS